MNLLLRNIFLISFAFFSSRKRRELFFVRHGLNIFPEKHLLHCCRGALSRLFTKRLASFSLQHPLFLAASAFPLFVVNMRDWYARLKHEMFSQKLKMLKRDEFSKQSHESFAGGKYKTSTMIKYILKFMMGFFLSHLERFPKLSLHPEMKSFKSVFL